MSKHQTGYEKGYSSQRLLIAIFERWRETLKRKVIMEGKCDLFVDLPEICDALLHDLLLAKQEAYKFRYSFLKLISSFLSKRNTGQKLVLHKVIGKVNFLLCLKGQR